MTVRKRLALASAYMIFFSFVFAEEEIPTLSPIIEWGAASISSYSYVSTLPIRVADQQPPPSQAPAQQPPDSAQSQPPPAQSAQPKQPAQQPNQQSSGNAGSATTPPASQPSANQPSAKAGSGSPKGGSPTGSNAAPSGTPAPKGSGSGTTSRSSFNWTPASSLPPFTTGSSETPPDVLLQIPTVGVKRIELDVDQLSADINLNAQVAGLVQLNAGIHASIQSVNLTITDVGAELELVIRLGHLADIVKRVFESLDLNPLLVGLVNNVTNILDTVVGSIDGLLGSITHQGTVLNFLVDNLGNIVQQVVDAAGNAVNSIVGSYQSNMTYTGKSQQLPNGLVQKTYRYAPLNALVNIVFNAAGQLVSAVVVKDGSGGQPSPSGGQVGGQQQQQQGGIPAGGQPVAQQQPQQPQQPQQTQQTAQQPQQVQPPAQPVAQAPQPAAPQAAAPQT